MDELDDRSGRHVMSALATTATGRQENCERAQALAAIVDYVMGDLIDERDIAAETLKDHAVHAGPFVPDQGTQTVERRAGLIGLNEGHEQMMPQGCCDL
jgi:hypothetical protein